MANNNNYCKTCIHHDTCEEGYVSNTCGGYRNKNMFTRAIDFEDYEILIETIFYAHEIIHRMRKSKKRDEALTLMESAIKTLKGEFTFK